MNAGNESPLKVRSARDALALLARKVYERFGPESLPLIQDVCGKLGRSVGERMRENLPDGNLKTVGKAFSEGASRRNNPVDIIELTDTIFHIKGYRCNLGLKDTYRELCVAMMAMDRGIFEGATGEKIDLKILRSLAAGDSCCEIVFELSKWENSV